MVANPRLSPGECYAQLGLPDDASTEEVEITCEEIESFLSFPRMSPAAKGWAEHQRRLTREARDGLRLLARSSAVNGRGVVGSTGPRRLPKRSPRPRRTAHPAGPGGRLLAALRQRAMPILAAVVVGLATLAIVLWVQRLTPPPAAPAARPPAESVVQQGRFAPLDTARVQTLKSQVGNDPSNKDALFELGERHFQAGLWQESLDWFTRLIAIDPSDVHARTDIGTANYDLGRHEEALAAWQEALKLAPDDAQLHYNLGFLYANSFRQDLDAAEREWELAARLGAGTELAVAAQNDLEKLRRMRSEPLAPLPTP